MTKSQTARRVFLKTLGVAGTIAALPLRHSRADDLPKLAPRDAAAAALGYVEDAAQVDTKKYPSYVKGSNCENCLQLQGKAGSSYRPCSLFPGKLVAAAGWCSSWTAEM